MSFKTLSIVRGFQEISQIFDICNSHNAVICGGYARYCCSRKTPPVPAGDVDIFPKSEGACEEIKQVLIGIGYTIKHENEISITFTNPKEGGSGDGVIAGAPEWACLSPTIQLIKPVKDGAIVAVGTLEEILGNFDFSVTRAGILSPSECLVDEFFLEDDKAMRLRLLNIHCPISSTYRCIKYSKKGYWLPIGESVKLFIDWQNRTPEYREDLLAKLTGIIGKNDRGEEVSEEEVQNLEKLLNID